MSKDTTEKELVGKFVLWAADLEVKPGEVGLVGPEHVAAIKAAAERIARQARANARNAEKAGRPRDKKPSKAALYKREQRKRQKATE